MNVHNYEERIQEYIANALEYKISRKRGRKTFCREMLGVAKNLGDDNFLGFAHYHMGDCLYGFSKQQNKALYHIKRAIMYGQRAQDRELLARCYNMLAIDAINRGLAELALEYHMIAKSQAVEEDSPELLAMICFNIGYSYMDMGDESGALKYFMESYRYCRKSAKDSRMAMYCRYIISCMAGVVYVKNKNMDRAAKMMKEVLHLEENDSDGVLVAAKEPLSFIFKIAYYRQLGDLDRFEEENNLFLDVLQDKNLPIDGVPDVLNYCQILIEAGSKERAGSYIEKLQLLMQEVNIPHLNMDFYKMLVAYYELTGEEDKKNQALLAYFENSKLQIEERKGAFSFYAEMMEAVERIRLENIALEKQARTDSLTQLPNRMDLNEVAEEWFDRAKKEQKSLGIEILDVDKFKDYNDTYEHQVGDICLEKIGEVLKDMTNENVYIARYGGDEFFVCYYDMSDDEIISFAKELKHRLEKIVVSVKDKDIAGISVSQGIRNTVPVSTNRVWDYLYAADNALYKLKQKNRGDILIIHKAIMSHKSLKDARIGN